MKTLLFTVENLVIPITIIITLALLVLLGSLFIRHNKKKKKSIKDDEFIASLVKVVGGIDNIKLVDVENRRLTIQLNDIKQLDQVALKDIVKGAFVTRDVVKIIMDEEASLIKEQLREIKK